MPAAKRPRKARPDAAGTLHIDHSLGMPSNFGLGSITQWIRDGSLTLDPPFQRAAVWTEDQREAWICSILDGLPLPSLFINQPRWSNEGEFSEGQMIVIDGRQRLEAILAFEDDRLTVRGQRFSQQPKLFLGKWAWLAVPTIFTRYQTMAECVDLYLRLLTAGTAHTPEDIEKAKAYRATLS